MRNVTHVLDAPRPHWVGDGFPVRSLLSHHEHGSAISPFLLLDYAGPYHFEPARAPRGVGEHPHRGFETVTIVYQGELEHRDSTGAGGKIGPGDVQWMTAASGVLHQEFHSEAFTAMGGNFEAVQLWVNLPAKDKMAQPGYQTLVKSEIPDVALPNGAGHVRVIAGSFNGVEGPARVHTALDIWDMRLNAGGVVELSVPEGHTLHVAVLGGTVLANDDKVAREAQVLVFDRTGDAVSIEANGEAKLLVLSGAPIAEPVAAYGPFVMNTPAEIHQAIEDLNAGRFGAIAA
jgi:redox-sensitive bicupin YhaK (pirin superfamily)